MILVMAPRVYLGTYNVTILHLAKLTTTRPPAYHAAEIDATLSG